jgi:hypothetical protein
VRWSPPGGNSGNAAEESARRRDKKLAAVPLPFLVCGDYRASAAKPRAQKLRTMYRIASIVSDEKASAVVEERRKRSAAAASPVYYFNHSAAGPSHEKEETANLLKLRKVLGAALGSAISTLSVYIGI